LHPPVLVIFFVQLPLSNMAKLAWPRWRELAAHPSSGVQKTVTTVSGTVQLPSLATLEGGSYTVPEAVVTVLCTPDDGCG